MSQFYITTPIYYVNDKPHLGHAYTTIFADILHRTYQLLGWETFFLTGTDEHGQKVYQAAKKLNRTPTEHVRITHHRFKEIWENLNIKYDFFIRTTDPLHVRYVQGALQKLYDQGDIYQKEYRGWYSVGEERFFAKEELVDGCDPISGRPVEWESEKNYFFRMGKYQKQFLNHLAAHPDFIVPASRMNEVLSFLNKPLEDLCISRPKKRLPWGIDLPFDTEFVTYVWFDALLNYLSAVQTLSWASRSNKPVAQTQALGLWPANAHIIGKDIVITHGVYFPTMLLALGLPLPEHLVAHGWWLQKGKKMSKSAGNIIDPVDLLQENMETDYCRYFLCKEMKLGSDVSYDQILWERCINTDLANGLGNTLNRLHKLISNINPDGKWSFNPCHEKFFSPRTVDWSCHTPTKQQAEESTKRNSKEAIESIEAKESAYSKPDVDATDWRELAPKHKDKDITALMQQIQELKEYTEHYLIWTSFPKNLARFDLSWLLEDIQEAIGKISILLETHAPWKLDPKKDKTFLTTLLFPCWEALRICFLLLLPVMPQKSRQALEVFGYKKEDFDSHADFNARKNMHVSSSEALSNDKEKKPPMYAWGNGPKKISQDPAPNIFPRWKGGNSKNAKDSRGATAVIDENEIDESEIDEKRMSRGSGSS